MNANREFNHLSDFEKLSTLGPPFVDPGQLPNKITKGPRIKTNISP